MIVSWFVLLFLLLTVETEWMDGWMVRV